MLSKDSEMIFKYMKAKIDALKVQVDGMQEDHEKEIKLLKKQKICQQ
jgi:hypothetical protein